MFHDLERSDCLSQKKDRVKKSDALSLLNEHS